MLKKLMFYTAIAGFAVTGPASALSCMAPDIVRSYEYAAAQDEIYFLLRGSITLTEGATRPEGRGPTVPGDTVEILLDPVQGSFRGEIFHEGTFVPFDSPIEVRLNCIVEWCGQYPDVEDALYFVSAAEGNLGLSVEMPACGGTRFPVSDAVVLIEHLSKQGVEGMPSASPSE